MKFLALPLMIVFTMPLADKSQRPKLSVKASPSMSMSPARIVASADVNGGADDFEEFYCASVEWDWGDDTKSNNTVDCDPYEPGKSTIKRRFTADHVYRTAGEYRIQFRLKKKNKSVASASTSVRIRPGLGDIGGDPWR
ncbi:MAG TPA: hypothetical protein VFK57_24520 [Vicinamibacterales bacterium]|nr:hypothetical protein [Vicinamibacterales bacterium]